MKERFFEEQISGFLRDAEVGLPVKEPCSKYGMDFVFDRATDGRVIKCLVIVDDATHEPVAIEAERAISGQGVSRVLDRLALSRGLPTVIRSDNGKEFCGKSMVTGAARPWRPAASDRTGQAESERQC